MSAPALTLKQRLINYYYFVIFCSLLACVVGIAYWFHGPVNYAMPMPELTNGLDILYIITTHFSVICFMFSLASLVLLPTVFISAKKSLIIQSVVVSLLIGLLIFDIGIFHADNMHINSIDMQLVNNILLNKEIMLRTNKIIA